jgi:protein-tyrosine phosphatase
LNAKAEISVLFVCMGNICRSPTAQGVFQQLVASEDLSDLIRIDSAGTHAYHIGESPDERAMEAASRRGIDLGSQRARRVTAADFLEFDYVLAMDRSNYEDLAAICPSESLSRLRLLMEFAPGLGLSDVPDPYYGGETGFERVLDLVEQAATELLADIRRQHRI